MAGMIFTVTHEGPTPPLSFAEAFPHAAENLQTVGDGFIAEVRRILWNRSLFHYRGRKVKPARSKSADAWTMQVDVTRGEIHISNPVEYAGYVHYAGTPRDDVLVKKVDELARTWAPERLQELFAADYEAARRAGGGR